MANHRKLTDPQLAEVRLWRANGGTDVRERAAHYSVSERYLRLLLDNERRPSPAEAILAATESDTRLEQMLAYYHTAIATAAREYFQGLDLGPLHTGVVGLMSSIYKMTTEEVEDALYPKLNGLSIEVSVGEGSNG